MSTMTMPRTSRQTVSTHQADDAVNAKVLRDWRPIRDRLAPVETLALLVKMRGTDRAILDVIDGLLLATEGDEPNADLDAFQGGLEELRTWAARQRP